MKDNFEFIIVNGNRDIWMVDYDNEYALRSSNLTVEHLRTDGTTFIRHDDSIVDFLEKKGYHLIDKSKYNNKDAFMFRKHNRGGFL